MQAGTKNMHVFWTRPFVSIHLKKNMFSAAVEGKYDSHNLKPLAIRMRIQWGKAMKTSDGCGVRPLEGALHQHFPSNPGEFRSVQADEDDDEDEEEFLV